MDCRVKPGNDAEKNHGLQHQAEIFVEGSADRAVQARGLSRFFKRSQPALDTNEALVDSRRDVSGLHDFAGDGARQAFELVFDLGNVGAQVGQLCIRPALEFSYLIAEFTRFFAEFTQQTKRLVWRLGH
jgi:hypothetical protein